MRVCSSVIVRRSSERIPVRIKQIYLLFCCSHDTYRTKKFTNYETLNFIGRNFDQQTTFEFIFQTRIEAK